jgi:hypothetical protein
MQEVKTHLKEAEALLKPVSEPPVNGTLRLIELGCREDS